MTTQATHSATQQTASGVDSTYDALDPRIDGIPTELIVGGQRRPASDRGTFPVLDPATGKTLADVANGTEADALACVDAAEAAAADWAATPPRRRGEILRAAFQLMVDRADQLAALIVAENGKALPDARGEVLYSAEFFRWYSEEAVRIDGQLRTAPAGTNRILVIHQPVGISVLVTPWNFPAAMASRKIGPALAAGCTVILKPASETPLTALALAAILEEAGAPAGVVNVLPSRRSGPVVGAMLAAPPGREQ
jgi:succinate-semialdehyde dehydrogenase/glutarate-semialdehyde dehydrogenase